MTIRFKQSSLLVVGLCCALAFFMLSTAHVAHAASFTVNTTADSDDAVQGDGICADSAGFCSLRAAISEANTLAGADTITIPAGVYTLSLAGVDEEFNATGDLDIRTGNLSLIGAGATDTIIQAGTSAGPTGNGVDRVLTIWGSITVDIQGLTIRHGLTRVGFADHGGGIWLANNGTLTLTRSVVADNYNYIGSGGGIANWKGTLVINNSTISGNGNSARGGGIANFYNDSTASTLIVNNSTIANNSALTGGGLSGRGGGIWNQGAATITNSTVVGNSAPTAGSGIFNDNTTGTVSLTNSIVANDAASNCSGTISSGGHNLDSGNTCALTVPGDLINTNPQLGLLANNGGPTPTHALLFNSPAIDAGDSTVCAALPIGGVDQRGELRNDLRCDIGAFELKLTDSAQVQKTVNGPGTYTFGPTLVQIAVSNDGGCLSGLDVAQTSTSFPNAPLGLQTGRYWTITPTGCSTGFSVNLTLPHSLGASFANARVCRNVGAADQWNCDASSATTTSVTRNAISDLSVWAVGDASLPLAVQLASFAAASQGDHVLVTWETVSERNNLGFNLYRGATPVNPDALLAFVPAQSPGSAQGAVYQWADSHVTAGATYYYWLEDVDLSGATTLHGPVSVTFERPTAVALTGFAVAGSSSALPASASLIAGLALAAAWIRRQLRQD